MTFASDKITDNRLPASSRKRSYFSEYKPANSFGTVDALNEIYLSVRTS